MANVFAEMTFCLQCLKRDHLPVQLGISSMTDCWSPDPKGMAIRGAETNVLRICCSESYFKGASGPHIVFQCWSLVYDDEIRRFSNFFQLTKADSCHTFVPAPLHCCNHVYFVNTRVEASSLHLPNSCWIAETVESEDSSLGCVILWTYR